MNAICFCLSLSLTCLLAASGGQDVNLPTTCYSMHAFLCITRCNQHTHTCKNTFKYKYAHKRLCVDVFTLNRHHINESQNKNKAVNRFELFKKSNFQSKYFSFSKLANGQHKNQAMQLSV